MPRVTLVEGINLALARGWVGREHCGLMPIRGHSGVQGGGEMGCIPNGLPGGRSLAAAAELGQRWGFAIPYMLTGYLNQHPKAAMQFMEGDDYRNIVKFYDEAVQQP